MELGIGDRYKGVYQVERILRGGMGIIYVCSVHPDSPDSAGEGQQEIDAADELKYVVWKSFATVGRWQADTASRFQREALHWISLPPHPNIVKATTLDTFMLMLEYVGGGSLRERLDRGLPGIRDVLSWSAQFADGMSFLHEEHGIIHRDIKPENTLLSREGVVKITDLGLAKALDEALVAAAGDAAPVDEPTEEDGKATFRTRGDGVAGTLVYMAPEQLLEKIPGTVASDIYSFGVMLYEMLTGGRPFRARNVSDLRALLRRHEYPPASLAGAPERLSQVADRCLARNPDHRYRSFTEVRDALGVFAAEAGLESSLPKRLSADELNARMTGGDWNGRGYGLGMLGRYEESFRCYQQALKLEPEFGPNLTNMGVALSRLGKLEEALPYLERATRAKDRRGATFRALAHHYGKLKRPDDLFETIRRSLVEFPRDIVMYRDAATFGVAYGRGDWVERGMNGLFECLRTDPFQDTARSWLNEGIQLAQSGAFDLGERVLTEAVKRFDRDALLAHNLGVVRFQRGDLKDVERLTSKALAIDALFGPPRLIRGLARILSGNQEAGLRDLVAAHEALPEDDVRRQPIEMMLELPGMALQLISVFGGRIATFEA